MILRFADWARRGLRQNHRSQKRRRSVPTWGSIAGEILEPRTMLSVTIAQPIVNSLPAGKDELIALDIANTIPQNAVSYTVSSDNPNVTASIVTGGQSLALNVSGRDRDGIDFNGTLIFRLLESEAPVTTARIISLVNSGFYNGLLFHRVIDNFVAQGGDPNGNGTGGSGTKFKDEFNTDLTFTSSGLLAMANSGDDTNDSQFFITDVDLSLAQQPQHLNFQHTIFGILTEGFDTFRKLMGTPTNSTTNKPLTNAVINSAVLLNDTQNGVLRVHAAPSFTGSATLTINANDGQGSTNQKQVTVQVVADTLNDRPFLGPVSNVTTNQGTPVTINVQGFDLEKDALTYVVKTSSSFSTDSSTGADPTNVTVSIQVTPASGNNPSTAAITFTPQAGFSGTLNLIVGVRDQTHRGGTGTTLNSRTNFDTQAITLTVNPVNHAPTTPGGSTGTPLNQPASIQLTADDGDSDKTQTLTYEIVAPVQHGTVSNFNPATGALLYTPNNNFSGVDTFTYRVKDNGGTVNGGSDTSTVTTFTIVVGVQTPTGLALETASDDGVSNDDRVISNATPKFTVNAQAGGTVKFLVNGSTTVTAQETSPGVYSATLAREMLQVGQNSITATITASGVTSSATTPLTFTYAPSYETVYTVPGTFGSAQQLTFQWSVRAARSVREFGVVTVDSLDGSINGIKPGDAGFLDAALASDSRQALFTRRSRPGSTETLNVSGGQLLVFYLVTKGGHAECWFWHEGGRARNTYFSVDDANQDGVDHLHVTADPLTGQMQMSWESGRRGGDRDYNDAVVTITPGAVASATVGDTLRIPGGPTESVPVTFTLAPVQRPGWWEEAFTRGSSQGEFGFFIVDDASGSVGGLQPGSSGYIQAALRSSTRQVVFSHGDAVGTERTLQIPGGALIAWYYIPEGTTANLLANNPNNDSDKGPYVLFSFDRENPDSAEHFRWYGPNRHWWNSPLSDDDLRLHVVDDLFASRAALDDLIVDISMPD